MRFSGRALLATAAAAAAVLFTPAAAFADYYGSETDYATSFVPADVDQYWACSAFTSAGAVCFTALGDYFKVYDDKKDGYSVVAEWDDTDSSRWGACVNKM